MKLFCSLITGSEVVLCDFHREKAWYEWTSKFSNGGLAQRDAVLSQLRKIASAATIEKMETAIDDFKLSETCKTNQKLSR